MFPAINKHFTTKNTLKGSNNGRIYLCHKHFLGMFTPPSLLSLLPAPTLSPSTLKLLWRFTMHNYIKQVLKLDFSRRELFASVLQKYGNTQSYISEEYVFSIYGEKLTNKVTFLAKSECLDNPM